MRSWAAALVVATVASTSYADSQVVHIEVDATVIRPIDGQGLNWDGPGGGDATIASDAVKRVGKKVVEKYLIQAGVGVALAPMAAAYAIDLVDKAFAPPDPFGEIVVDGRVVGALDVQQDKFTPSWPTPAMFVELKSTSTVEVTLIDEDLSGAHDPIGTCSFKIPALKNASPVTLTSKACSDDLLAASIIVRLAPSPQPVTRGRYKVVTVRAWIPPTDRDGTEWDVSTRPDPKIDITVGTKRFQCSKNEGQRSGICAPRLVFDLDEATTIGIHVVEEDPFVDDPAGVAAVGDLLTRETNRPIPMTIKGLEWAEVVLIPVTR
jgi:hypothetical protein